jgi:hypothetical protein
MDVHMRDENVPDGVCGLSRILFALALAGRAASSFARFPLHRVTHLALDPITGDWTVSDV